MKGLLFFLFCAALLGGANGTEVVSFFPDPSVQTVIQPNKKAKLLFRIRLEKGWHIYANPVHSDFLVPATITVKGGDAVMVDSIVYPSGVEKSFFGVTEGFYEGEVSVAVILHCDVSGAHPIEVNLRYQACDDRVCLPPAEKTLSLTMTVKEAAGGWSFAGKGLPMTLLLLFLAGLALNLTPCVYPVIPITLSFFAGQAASRRSIQIGLALFYVLGMALTYSTLGVAAAFSGKMLGAALQHPAVLWAIVLLFVLLALSMFGLYDIRVPAFLSRLGVGRKGYLGALSMGLIVGLVAAPCVGPVTAGLLLHVAEQRDASLGFLYFFVLSLGLGTPYFLLGLFSGSLKKLPGAGGWMVWIRKFFGFVLLLLALNYAAPLVSNTVIRLLALLTGAVGALYLGFIEKSARGRHPGFERFQRLFGMAVVVTLIFFSVQFWQNSSDMIESNVAAHPALTAEKLDSLLAAGRPFVVDFRADWCAPCRKMEATTFADGRVHEALKRVPLFTVDVTRDEEVEARGLVDRYKVTGVPTLLYFNGRTAVPERTTEYLDADSFLHQLKALLSEVNP